MLVTLSFFLVFLTTFAHSQSNSNGPQLPFVRHLKPPRIGSGLGLRDPIRVASPESVLPSNPAQVISVGIAVIIMIEKRSIVDHYILKIPIDHFPKVKKSSSGTFENRYWVNATYWKPGGPVFRRCRHVAYLIPKSASLLTGSKVFDSGEQDAEPLLPYYLQVNLASWYMIN